MTELVKVQHHAHGLVEVGLNRPDKMNAITPAMFDELIAAGEALIHQPGLRCVLLRGEGKAFCAGLMRMVVPVCVKAFLRCSVLMVMSVPSPLVKVMV